MYKSKYSPDLVKEMTTIMFLKDTNLPNTTLILNHSYIAALKSMIKYTLQSVIC